MVVWVRLGSAAAASVLCAAALGWFWTTMGLTARTPLWGFAWLWIPLLCCGAAAGLVAAVVRTRTAAWWGGLGPILLLPLPIEACSIAPLMLAGADGVVAALSSLPVLVLICAVLAAAALAPELVGRVRQAPPQELRNAAAPSRSALRRMMICAAAGLGAGLLSACLLVAAASVTEGQYALHLLVPLLPAAAAMTCCAAAGGLAAAAVRRRRWHPAPAAALGGLVCFLLLLCVLTAAAPLFAADPWERTLGSPLLGILTLVSAAGGVTTAAASLRAADRADRRVPLS